MVSGIQCEKRGASVKKKQLTILWFLIILILIPHTVFGETPTPSPTAGILRFRLYRNDFLMPQNYEIFLLGDAYYLYRNDDLPILLDPHDADDLVRIIDQYDVRAWDGFDDSNYEVEDGEFFYFSAVLTDGTSIYAEGQNAFPPNYSPAASLMEELILRADGETIEEDFSLTRKERSLPDSYSGQELRCPRSGYRFTYKPAPYGVCDAHTRSDAGQELRPRFSS